MNERQKMEKSSLNIKSFRNLLSNQGKSYKIPPDTYQPTEVKLINGTIIDNATSCSIEDIYSLKRHKTNAVSDNRKRIRNVFCGNFARFINYYNNSNFCLPIFTPIFSSVCVIIVIAALFGTSWITTEEKIPWHQVNSSLYRYNNNFTVSYIIKSSNASLWIICTRFAIDDNHTKFDYMSKNCTRIDYFDTEKYQPDLRDSPNESNNVIPYTITVSSPILIISFIILLISYLLFLLAICSQKYKIFYFIAGIGFIISGLLMLSGLIMFISIFKSEVFHKLQTTTSNHQEPLFTFNYGHSFILYLIGFVIVELAGILNVCFFNKLQNTEEHNQSHLLNNYVKPVTAASNHHTHIAFTNMDNGYILPQKSGIQCSLHTAAASANVKFTNDCYSNNNNMPFRSKHQFQQRPILPNRFDGFNHVPFTRNASTSTLDLDNELDEGDSMSLKSNHRMMKDKSGSNKLDFNNICGMMRSAKSKECNGSVYHRAMKPARNIYYIKDQADEEEPNIFIVDPRFYKNRKGALQKSLEDIRMQKMNNNSYGRHYHHDTISCGGNGWNNTMDRNYYGSKTLPRDFSRPKPLRPSLDDFLNNFHQNENRLNPLRHNHSHLHSHYHHQPTGYTFHHHNSCDELLASKLYRNSTVYPNFTDSQTTRQQQQQEYQWPKVIPKSPSSYSMNSFRISRQSAYDRSSTYNPIEEFDLDKIEHERRKSHTNLFKEGRQQQQNELKKEFGTAV